MLIRLQNKFKSYLQHFHNLVFDFITIVWFTKLDTPKYLAQQMFNKLRSYVKNLHYYIFQRKN